MLQGAVGSRAKGAQRDNQFKLFSPSYAFFVYRLLHIHPLLEYHLTKKIGCPSFPPDHDTDELPTVASAPARSHSS